MEALGGVGWWTGRPGADGAGLRGGARALAVDRRRARDRQRALQPLVHLRRLEQPCRSGSRRRRAWRHDGGARRGSRRSATTRASPTQRGASATTSTSTTRTTTASRGSSASLEIFRRVGDVTMEAWSLHMLGSGLDPAGQGRRRQGRAPRRRSRSSTGPATSPGSHWRSTTSPRSPSRRATCPARPASGVRRARCRRPAASCWPTSSTRSSSSIAARTRGSRWTRTSSSDTRARAGR